jgi:antirestriction protein ArdC
VTGGLGALRDELLAGRSSFQPLQRCEQVVVTTTAAAIRHHGTLACYDPAADTITVPPRATFRSAEGYYSTLFHELTHRVDEVRVGAISGVRLVRPVRAPLEHQSQTTGATGRPPSDCKRL